jgi:hypothetical protein
MHYTNCSRLPIPAFFQVGQLIYLDHQNLTTSCPSKKLDDKKLGSFCISLIINEVTFELALPSTMKIHPVFHASLLEPAPADLHMPHSCLPPVIHSSSEYEVEHILDMKTVCGKTKFLVHWKGYSPEEWTWEPLCNLANC